MDIAYQSSLIQFDLDKVIFRDPDPGNTHQAPLTCFRRVKSLKLSYVTPFSRIDDILKVNDGSLIELHIAESDDSRGPFSHVVMYAYLV